VSTGLFIGFLEAILAESERMNFLGNTRMRRMLIWNCFVIVIIVECLTAIPAFAKNILFVPSIAVSEEFTDNIFEDTSNKRYEFITRLQPGFTSRYQAPVWNWDIGYTFDYRNYARNSRGDEYTHDANLKGTITLLENFLYLDLDDRYQRVLLDITRNVATESSLFLNQTDQNAATISPYLLWRLASKSSLKTGYRFNDTRYWDPAGINRQEHIAFAGLNHEVTAKLAFSADYGFTRLESRPTQYNKHDISAGFRYVYAEKSFIFGQIGNSWQQFNNNVNTSYVFWNAGVTHDFLFAVATVETKVQTATDPLAVSTKESSYSGKLEKTLQRGAIGISTSYSEFVDTESNNGTRRKFTINGSGRYEVIPSFNPYINVTAERFYNIVNAVNTGTEFPYHLNATTGLIYDVNHDITINLNYTYDTKRNDIDNARGAIEISRVFLEVKKVF
jgi:hypothetical protein